MFFAKQGCSCIRDSLFTFFILTILLIQFYASARAETFVVNSTLDAVDSDLTDGRCETSSPGECTLRAAIQQSNALPGFDEIDVPPGKYALSIADNAVAEDAGVSGDLDIDDVLLIKGSGAVNSTFISGADKFRVFDILARGGVEIQNIVIEHGLADGSGGGGIRFSGISNNVTSTMMSRQPYRLVGVTVQNCHADSKLGYGGAIFNGINQVLVLASSSMSNNSAAYGGAVYSNGTVLSNNSIISGNSANTGAGFYAHSRIYLQNSTVSDNVSNNSGGGIVADANLIINNSTLSANQATMGGAVQFKGSNNVDEYFYIGASTLANNKALNGNGGAIYAGLLPIVDGRPILIVSSDINGNSASSIGGGAYIDNLSLINASVIQNNSATRFGGGAYLGHYLSAFNNVSEIANSLFSVNDVTSDSGVAGGGLYLTDSNYHLVNTTLSGNTAHSNLSSGYGGGIFAPATAKNVNLEFTTLYENMASTKGSNLALFATSVLSRSYTIKNSIIVGDGGNSSCLFGTSTLGSLSDNYNIVSNISGDTSCGFDKANDVLTIFGVVTALNNNGGPTLSHLPLNTSPLLTAIPQSVCQVMDQRGFVRTGDCGPGAVELAAASQPRGEVVFKFDSYSAIESDGSVTVTLSRLNGSSGPLKVMVVPTPYEVTQHVATIGDIKNSLNGPVDVADAAYLVEWADSDTADKSIQIAIKDDTLYEGVETFNLTLFDVDTGFTQVGRSATTTAQKQAAVIINDDETAPSAYFRFQSPSYTALPGQRSIFVTVARLGASDVSQSVSAATSGSAVVGEDFVIDNLTLDFLPGEDQKPLIINIPNAQRSQAKQLTLTLGSPHLPTGSDFVTQVIIPVNNVVTPANSVEFATATTSMSEGDAPIQLSITRSGDLSLVQTVSYQVDVSSTATLTDDYTLSAINSGSSVANVTFAAGESVKSIDLSIVDDTLPEPDETLNLVLLNTSADLVLGANKAHTVTIHDNDQIVNPANTISFSKSAINVLESVGKVSVVVERSGDLSQAVNLELVTSGTATVVDDYNLSSRQVSLAQGESSISVDLNIVDDNIVESEETIVLTVTNISSSSNIVVGNNPSEVINISDNDSGAQSSATAQNTKSSDGGGGAFLWLNLMILLVATRSGHHFEKKEL